MRIDLAPPPPLSVPLTPTLGREGDVEAVRALLFRTDVRLVSLTGIGGIGKTRVALEVAAALQNDFEDGVYFVSLATVRQPEHVVDLIARTLGLHRHLSRMTAEILNAALHQRQLLLVLDNFEHVMPAAPLLAELLANCPTIKVLLTSREALRLNGEHRYVIAPLAFPHMATLPAPEILTLYPAVDLFVRRARAIAPDLPLDDDSLRAVAEICARLEGLPLAIELAAARSSLLTPQDLLLRLARSLALLTQGGPDRPERHRTLRAALAWSYDLLSEDEQRVYRRLAVFVDGFNLAAAEAVCTISGDISSDFLDVVGSLINKSLVLPEHQPTGERRLRLMEVVREFALECLTTRGELDTVQQAHAAYYLALAERAEPELLGRQLYIWMDSLEEDNANLNAALRLLLAAHDLERSTRLAGSLRWFWYNRHSLSEGLEWLEQVVCGLQEGIPLPGSSKVLMAAGLFAGHLGRQKCAMDWLKEGLARCAEDREVEDYTLSAFVLVLGLLVQGDLAQARAELEKAEQFAQGSSDPRVKAELSSTRGTLHMYLGEYDSALELFEQSALFCGEAGDLQAEEVALLVGAAAQAARGDEVHAQVIIEQHIHALEARHSAWSVGYILCDYGRLCIQSGATRSALLLLNNSLTLFRRLGDQRGVSVACSGLALAALHQQDCETAVELAAQCLQHARAVGAPEITVSCLAGLADMAARQGMLTTAGRLWGAAEHLHEHVEPAYSATDPPIRYELMNSARESLGAETFKTIWEAGRSSTAEDVLSVLKCAGPSGGKGAAAPARPGGLSRRESQVLQLVSEGLSNAEIAERLVISPATVPGYLNVIYRKLGVTSRTAAMRYAIDHDLH
jgi:predicted ATPase/DNA-binding CsgD family transcriptional regulator